MKISTKTTLIILATLLIGTAIGILGSGIFHQKRFDRIRQMHPEQRFVEILDRIIKPAEEQSRLIKEILEKQSKKIAALEENYQGEIFTIFDSTRIQIQSLLTKEQMNKLEQEMSRGGEKFAARMLERLDNDLDLTDDQREKIEEIFKEMSKNSKFDESPFTGRKGFRKPGFRQLRMEMDKKIEAVLTPEQAAKFREYKENRKPHFSKPFDMPPFK